MQWMSLACSVDDSIYTLQAIMDMHNAEGQVKNNTRLSSSEGQATVRQSAESQVNAPIVSDATIE